MTSPLFVKCFKEQLSLTPGKPRQQLFRQGVLTELLNPKTALFFLAVIPQFVNPKVDHVFWQFILLGSTSVAVNTLNAVLVVTLAGFLGTRLQNNPRF